ncbi:YbaB/EbfC family nucleoid-associated protein [Actinoplanes sp. HUAS TT8]|uniref:YbaB/EbfC family nucleoid-associated protein n=1 Tax=Actinoplanes sp. HUAS TT8 TaxID=3447453 RepID=UPI003F5233CB
MTSPMQNRIEQAMAEFERHRAAMDGFEHRVAEASTTVTAKNRAVAVTVNGKGELSEIRFPVGTYRTMAPAELGRLLVDTIGEAQQQAREKAAQMFESLLPAGLPVLEMLSKPVDFDEAMGEVMKTIRETQQPHGGLRPDAEEEK